MEIGCVYIVIAAQRIMARNDQINFTFYELIGLSTVTVPHATAIYGYIRVGPPQLIE